MGVMAVKYVRGNILVIAASYRCCAVAIWAQNNHQNILLNMSIYDMNHMIKIDYIKLPKLLIILKIEEIKRILKKKDQTKLS